VCWDCRPRHCRYLLTNNTGDYKGFMDCHQTAPVGDTSDSVYYNSHQLQQHEQPTEYAQPHQAIPSLLPPLLSHFTSINDTTRFPGLQLPHPTQSQDTRNQAQYDTQYWVQWNTPRMSDSLQTDISPQIPQLTQDNPEPFHRLKDNEYMPPMGSSHKHTMPRLSGLQDKQENESQATNKPTNHKSVLGMDGMPDPRPLCEFKQKFTVEDDEILRQLKHDCKDPYRLGSKDDGLTWRQIAEFFPGRAPGTLQVHYCKEVSAKGPQWDAELVCSSWKSSPN
jgi:hypothetical protein